MKSSTNAIIAKLFERYPVLSDCSSSILSAVSVLILSFRSGGKLLTCGNGGSAADAAHVVGELMKGFVLPRPIGSDIRNRLMAFSQNGEYIGSNLQEALPALSLMNEIALVTAYANDKSSDLAFAQQVYAHGRKEDVLLAISTSGNSANVLYAAEVARVLGIKVLTLTGASGGKLKDISDVSISVPETETYRIQELHLPVYHAICLAIENEFFGDV